MTTWSEDDPGAGDPDIVYTRASALSRHVEHAAEMTVSVRSGLGHMQNFWSGDAHDAWTASMTEATASWTAVHGWAELEYSALRRYAAAIEWIAERARPQKALLQDARLQLRLFSANSPLGIEPVAPTSQEVEHRQALDHAQAGLAQLAAERQEADDALAASLREARQTSRSADTRRCRRRVN